MGIIFFLSLHLGLEPLLALTFAVAGVSANYRPYLDPGFFFDYNKPGEPVPIPITQQCETIHLRWGRSTARGPNPVAPYFMQIYASTFISPFVIPVGNGLTFDWEVPFGPGTQYQICMFDKNGLTGGCQAIYTVIQNTTTLEPTCQNVTAAPLLNVLATVPGGPMSQYGFIDQCTDLSVTPVSGHPPYTLTIAPALHPPYNITSNSMDPIFWTVSLSWAFPFFVSLVSADGQTWANGPMHVGGFGPSNCLAPGTVSREGAHRIALGAGIGSMFAGLLGGAVLAILILKFWHRRHEQHLLPSEDLPTRPPPDYEAARPLPPIPSLITRVRSFGVTDSGFLGAVWPRPRHLRMSIQPYTMSRSGTFPTLETKGLMRGAPTSPPSAAAGSRSSSHGNDSMQAEHGSTSYT